MTAPDIAKRLRECDEKWQRCRALRPRDARAQDALCDTGDWLGSAAIDAADELDRLAAENAALRQHQCALPSSISEALNSGDGTYRP